MTFSFLYFPILGNDFGYLTAVSDIRITIRKLINYYHLYYGAGIPGISLDVCERFVSQWLIPGLDDIKTIRSKFIDECNYCYFLVFMIAVSFGIIFCVFFFFNYRSRSLAIFRKLINAKRKSKVCSSHFRSLEDAFLFLINIEKRNQAKRKR